MLQLNRPIAFIDLETTGVTLSTDRIVEIAMVKLMPDGTRLSKRKILNPGIEEPGIARGLPITGSNCHAPGG